MAPGSLAIRELDFEATATPTARELRMAGNADARVVEPLNALVSELHAELRAAHARHVTVDLRRLEFMNASCFNILVNWLHLVIELAPEERYELRFTTNQAIPWQRRSLRTLSCFATDLVVLT
jgi:hypothetical protein